MILPFMGRIKHNQTIHFLLTTFGDERFEQLIRKEVIAEMNKEWKARQKARKKMDLCSCGNRIDRNFKHLGL